MQNDPKVENVTKETIMKRIIRFVMNANGRYVLILQSAEVTLLVPSNFSVVGALCYASYPLLRILPSVSPNGV
jgi:hypothetical protein